MGIFGWREVVEALFHNFLKELFVSEFTMQQLEEGTMHQSDYLDQL